MSLCAIQFVSTPHVDIHLDQISSANEVRIQNINIFLFFPTTAETFKFHDFGEIKPRSFVLRYDVSEEPAASTVRIEECFATLNMETACCFVTLAPIRTSSVKICEVAM